MGGGPISLASGTTCSGSMVFTVGSGERGDLGGLKCSEGRWSPRSQGDPLNTTQRATEVKAEAQRLQLELWLRDQAPGIHQVLFSGGLSCTQHRAGHTVGAPLMILNESMIH